MSFEMCNHAVVKIVSFCLLLSNEWVGFKIKVTSVHSDQVCTPEERHKCHNPAHFAGNHVVLGVGPYAPVARQARIYVACC